MALHQRAEAEAVPHIVRPSMPILFFGDSRRYECSTLKVITVGLNPSKLEFPNNDPFRRFPAARELPPMLLNGSLDAYRSALDEVPVAPTSTMTAAVATSASWNTLCIE